MTELHQTPSELRDAPHGPEGVALHGPNYQVYTVIAVALSIFTAVSFVVNVLVRDHYLTAVMGFLVILGVAIVKATLVGMYFMHIKYDWRLLYFLLVPAFILATMMAIVLLPDIVFAWHNEPIITQQPVTAHPPGH
jgi:cytochrome c oxidase subunit 4